MASHHPDEVFGCVSRKRGFVKVCVGGDEVVGSGVKIREIAPASSGYSDFLAGVSVAFEDQNRATTLTRFDRAHQPRRAGPDNDNVVAHMRIIYCRITKTREECLSADRKSKRCPALARLPGVVLPLEDGVHRRSVRAERRSSLHRRDVGFATWLPAP